MSNPLLKKVRKAIKDSGLTYEEVGERMGYAKESARQSVFQFINSKHPTVEMLKRFADAMELDVRDLL